MTIGNSSLAFKMTRRKSALKLQKWTAVVLEL